MNLKSLKIIILILFIFILYIILNLKKDIITGSIIIKDYSDNQSKRLFEYCTFFKCINPYIVNKFDFLVGVSLPIDYYVSNKTVVTNTLQFNIIKESIKNNKRFSKHENVSFIIPNIDLLVGNDYFPSIIDGISNDKRLNGSNCLIFTFICNEDHLRYIRTINYPIIFASASSYHPYYRSEVDVSIPYYNSLSEHVIIQKRKYFIFFMQRDVLKHYPTLLQNSLKISGQFKNVFRKECPGNIITKYEICISILESGSIKSLVVPSFTTEMHSSFCVIFNFGLSIGFNLFNAMSKNCIPVIFTDKYVLPFSEVLDWNRCAILLRQYQIPDINTILSTLSEDTVKYYRKHCSYFFSKYMSSMDKIVETTLAIVETRFFPLRSKSYFWWNEPDYDSIYSSRGDVEQLVSKTIYPVSFLHHMGFTAIVFVNYQCITKSEQLLLNKSLDNLVQFTGLVHIVFVINKNCVLNIDMLSIRITFIKISAKENRSPYRYSYFSNIKTRSVLILHWHLSIPQIKYGEINNGYKTWLLNMDQLVGVRYNTCKSRNVIMNKYPVDAVFLDAKILKRYSIYLETVLNTTQENSKLCCNQDLMLSRFWKFIYTSKENFTQIDQNCS